MVICDRSKAKEMLIGPNGIEGTIGETLMERNDKTFPIALITATKTTPLEDLKNDLMIEIVQNLLILKLLLKIE